MKRIYNTLLLLTILLVMSCAEDIGLKPNKIGEKPANLVSYTVRPISGGAAIKYTLPKSEDLRYVLARYTTDDGLVMERKSSIYQDSVVLTGYGKEGTYNVDFYTVSVGEVYSDVKTISVNVLTPPHVRILELLTSIGNISEAFGGFNFEYFNETEADIVVKIMRKDPTGWVSLRNIYTSFRSELVRIRGQKAEPTEFGIVIEDKWDRVSDTLKFTLTPKPEVEITPRHPITNAELFKDFRLPTDMNNVPYRSSSLNLEKMWDGLMSNQNNQIFFSPQVDLPISFTMDMGRQVMLSRIHGWLTRFTTVADVYGPAHVRDFEIYGSNNPNPDGSWESWELIDRFQGVRPSGLPMGAGATSTEATAYRDNGEIFEFTNPEKHYRYLRFRVLSTWRGTYTGPHSIFIFEMKFYGQEGN